MFLNFIEVDPNKVKQRFKVLLDGDRDPTKFFWLLKCCIWYHKTKLAKKSFLMLPGLSPISSQDLEDFEH